MTGLSESNKNARRGRITASAYPKIAAGGKSRESEISAIAAEWLCLPSERREFDTPAMAHGRARESKGIELFAKIIAEQRHKAQVAPNNEFLDTTFNDFPIGATPDGFCGTNEVIEIKAPATPEAFEEQSKRPPMRYIRQVQFQIFVTNTFNFEAENFGYLVFVHPTEDIVKYNVIHLSQENQKEIEAILTNAINDIQKQIDGGRRTADGETTPSRLDERIHALADKKLSLSELQEEAKRIKKIIDDEIRKQTDIIEKEEESLAPLVRNIPADLRPAGVRITKTKSAIIDDPDKIPDEYCNITRKPALRKITAALQNGEIPGARLEDKTTVSFIKSTKTADTPSQIDKLLPEYRFPIAKKE